MKVEVKVMNRTRNLNRPHETNRESHPDADLWNDIEFGFEFDARLFVFL